MNKRSVFDKSDRDKTETFINVGQCEFEPSAIDPSENDVNDSAAISDTTIFDTISGDTSRETALDITGETLNSSNENIGEPNKSLPSASQSCILSDECYYRSVETRLFEDPDEPETDYELIRKRTSKNKKVRKNKENNKRIKKSKCNNRSNFMTKKEKRAFEEWAKQLNKHFEEIESYQLCVE